jgi:methyltransferase (TIGR00027 family)
MALFRALESTRPAGRRLFEDPFAAAFLRPRLRIVVGLSRLPWAGHLIRGFIDHRWPGARTSAVARTRFIDEATNVAIASGIEQVVVLGAGFDARAHRLAAMAGLPVLEVDHPATSAAKRASLEGVLGSIPSNVRLVPVDLDSTPLRGAMTGAGYDATRRSLVIWEGVTNYLTDAAVDDTLRWCATAAPGSIVVFTYVHRRVLDAPQEFEGTGKLFATLDASGEGWTFGFEPSALAAFLAERGLVLEQDVGAADYRAACYGPAASRMVGYEFYRIAVARVPAASGPSR